MRIKVTSDSTCDLTPEALKEHDIEIFPLSIKMGEQLYKDGVDIIAVDTFRHVEAGGDLCSTIAVNVQEYQDRFEVLSKEYDAVIHINISSDFSSCYQNACIAAEDLDNVYVVDSRNLSSGHGHVVMEAALKAEEGKTPEEILAHLEAVIPCVNSSFILDRLDYMRKGGRCSTVQALGANLLKLKPCIEVADGKMHVSKKYRGNLEKVMMEYTRDRLKNPDELVLDRVYITSPSADPELIAKIKALIPTLAPFKTVEPTVAGCTVGCHCGPNTIGVLYIMNHPKVKE